MTRVLLLLIAALALAGCEQTLEPDEFLYYYRRGSIDPYNSEGFRSRYTGGDMDYHYMSVRRQTTDRGADDLLLSGPFQDETFRCPKSQLPRMFPEDFDTLTSVGRNAGETPEQTRRYIDRYLAAWRSELEAERRANKENEDFLRSW